MSDSYFPITPFSATLNCGSYATTWTFTGVNDTDGSPLNSATHLIGVNPTTGSISVSKNKPVGNYTIKVIGTLPDLVTTFSATFTININATFKYIPVFSSPLNNVNVLLMKLHTYKFPSIIDPSIGGNSSVSFVKY